MITVALMTCGRYEYTARTLASFAAHNDLRKFQLLHGDDASDNRKDIARLVKPYGFRTVVQHKTQLGWLPLRTALIARAAARGRWILLLENDIESIRPFPWALFARVQAHDWIYCLRLYGAFKDAEQLQPCKTTNQWRGHAPVSWKALKNAPEPAEVAQIHWSAQPCVTRAGDLVAIHQGHREVHLKTARVVTNVMNHFGVERTPKRVRAVAVAS